MIDYKMFQETYKKINKTKDKSFFDRLLIPLVSSLNYQMKSFYSSTGVMLIEHNKQLITAFPDDILKIVFTFDDISYKYDNHTLLVALDLQQERINIMMPYFGEYRSVLSAEFFKDEAKYKHIMSILDFKILNSVDADVRKKLFYKLIIKYDINNNDKCSKLLLFEINQLLQNADSDLINLISDKIYIQSEYNQAKLISHFNNLLKQQDENSHYKVINTLEEKKNDNNINEQQSMSNSFDSIVNNVMNNGETNKKQGDRRAKIAESFKQ